ncbi:MAG: regulatory protein RecX [Actinomycetaceae bacterium]|nr:regulatory protein RecX [Actinomycetaceae bacterium]MDY6083014.1 regulatory protein RecX [Actinomycetaceae bacterium]
MRRRSTFRSKDHEQPLSLEDQEERGRTIILRQLAMVDRSRAQLQRKLNERGISDEVAANLLDHFEDLGLVDDHHFAEVFVRTRFAEKTLSKAQLRRELAQAGVDGDIAEEAVAAISDDDEFDAAVTFAAKKLMQSSGKPDTLEKRTWMALARRGFSSSTASAAIRHAHELLSHDTSEDDISAELL